MCTCWLPGALGHGRDFRWSLGGRCGGKGFWVVVLGKAKVYQGPNDVEGHSVLYSSFKIAHHCFTHAYTRQ